MLEFLFNYILFLVLKVIYGHRKKLQNIKNCKEEIKITNSCHSEIAINIYICYFNIMHIYYCYYLKIGVISYILFSKMFNLVL